MGMLVLLASHGDREHEKGCWRHPREGNRGFEGHLGCLSTLNMK